VLGAGAWAEFAHIPGWLRDPRCEVVALCDVEGDRAADFARKFGQHEKEHIKALEKAAADMGSEPPQRAEAQFPLDGPRKIIEFASGLESLGAAALLAQASRIEDKELLAAALSMHSVEARHVAALASLLGEDPAPQGPYAQPIQAGDVLSQLHRLTTGNAA
jgi:hypothetical protein